MDNREGASHNTRAYIEEEGQQQLRRSLTTRPDRADARLPRTPYGDQIAYLHNEFNFDTARPLENVALVSHVSFVPIFPPKLVADRAPPAMATNGLSIGTDAVTQAYRDRVDALRRRAVHEVESEYAQEDFRGGKDSVTRRVHRILSYDQRVITTLRSVERLYNGLAAYFSGRNQSAETRRAASRGAEWTKRLSDQVTSQGLSSRVSMLREFMLLMSSDGLQRFHLRWVRHHNHHQTLTAIQEAHVEPSVIGVGEVKNLAFDAAPTLGELLCACRSKGDMAASCLTEHTAFDALPDFWASSMFGRFLQGANYLLIPLEYLFEPQYLANARAHPHSDTRGSRGWDDAWENAASLCWPDAEAPALAAGTFRALWREAQTSPSTLRAAARVALGIMGPLLENALPEVRREKEVEFVFFGAADGAAIVASDIRNFPGGGSRPAMSTTVVVDLGMNDFERGRLIKNLTEFSTRRFLALTHLGSFRFFNDALDVIQADLSRATKAWLGSGRKGSHEEMRRDRSYVGSLQEIVVNLGVLNDLVDGGLSAHSTSAQASSRRAYTCVEAVRELRLPGFMCLSDFLDRRYSKSVRAIVEVGERYQLLRQRIGELSTLVETRVEIGQNEQQSELLTKVDRLTLFGITYYFGTMIAYILASLVFMLQGRSVTNVSELGDLLRFWTFLPLIGFAVWIGREILLTLFNEARPSNTGWFRRRSARA